MAKKLRKCPKCKRYMLKEVCEKCGIHTYVSHPPKFSLDDPFLEYKAKAFLESLKASKKEV